MAHYQLVESYRENGMPRQRIIATLGECATAEEALARWRRWLANIHPRNARDEQRRTRLCQRIARLEAVVSKSATLGDISATTPGAD